MILAIIGGGASGMMAALSALRSTGAEVHLFERQSRLGRKLLATGNGRCNLSNRNAAAAHYHGRDPGFVAPALQELGVDDTLELFSQLGLLTVCEPDGKLYPFSDQANSVVDVLRLALEQSAAQLHLGCEVSAIVPRDGGFALDTPEGAFFAHRVIVAAGSQAGGKLGGTGAGYALLRQLGHRCTKLYPSLVQLQTDPAQVRALKGVRACAQLTLLRGKQQLGQEQGELQFTDFGLSGPCAFALSRIAATEGPGLTAQLDLCPGRTAAQLTQLLQARQAAFPALPLENFLTGLLHNRLGRTLLRTLQLDFASPCASLSYRTLAAIAGRIKCWQLPVRGCLPLEQAQVAAGGIETGGFDSETLESRLIPGLYATGEVLDIDGDCGGYNLQWAWSSGYLAGQLRHKAEEEQP